MKKLAFWSLIISAIVAVTTCVGSVITISKEQIEEAKFRRENPALYMQRFQSFWKLHGGDLVRDESGVICLVTHTPEKGARHVAVHPIHRLSIHANDWHISESRAWKYEYVPMSEPQAYKNMLAEGLTAVAPSQEVRNAFLDVLGVKIDEFVDVDAE